MNISQDTKDMRAENVDINDIMSMDYSGPVKDLLDELDARIEKCKQNSTLSLDENYKIIEFRKGFGKTHAAMNYLGEKYDEFSHIVYKDNGRFEIINYSKQEDSEFITIRKNLESLSELDNLETNAIIFDDIHYLLEANLNGVIDNDELYTYLMKTKESSELRETLSITDSILKNYVGTLDTIDHFGKDIHKFIHDYSRNGHYNARISTHDLHSYGYHLERKLRRGHWQATDDLKKKIRKEIDTDDDPNPLSDHLYSLMDFINNINEGILTEHERDVRLAKLYESVDNNIETYTDNKGKVRKRGIKKANITKRIGEEIIEVFFKTSTLPIDFLINEENIVFDYGLEGTFNFYDHIRIKSSVLNFREIKRLGNKIENKTLEEILLNSFIVNSKIIDGVSVPSNEVIDVIRKFEDNFTIFLDDAKKDIIEREANRMISQEKLDSWKKDTYIAENSKITSEESDMIPEMMDKLLYQIENQIPIDASLIFRDVAVNPPVYNLMFDLITHDIHEPNYTSGVFDVQEKVKAN